MHVVRNPSEAKRLTASWFRLSHVLVAQEYIPGGEEWRVGTLGGELLYACRYGPPSEEARLQALSLEEVPYIAANASPAANSPRMSCGKRSKPRPRSEMGCSVLMSWSIKEAPMCWT